MKTEEVIWFKDDINPWGALSKTFPAVRIIPEHQTVTTCDEDGVIYTFPMTSIFCIETREITE